MFIAHKNERININIICRVRHCQHAHRVHRSGVLPVVLIVDTHQGHHIPEGENILNIEGLTVIFWVTPF